MMQGIAFRDLPKTFREAIILARHLQLRYLWIDSLCIIQDSAEDWAEESAQMELVYRNLVCNIAAAAAANSEEGCFVNRDPKFAQACRLHIFTASHRELNTNIYDPILRPTYGVGHPLSDSPLNKRAWVLQEQYLSKRIIYCTRNQLLWKCGSLASCYFQAPIFYFTLHL